MLNFFLNKLYIFSYTEPPPREDLTTSTPYGQRPGIKYVMDIINRPSPKFFIFLAKQRLSLNPTTLTPYGQRPGINTSLLTHEMVTEDVL